MNAATRCAHWQRDEPEGGVLGRTLQRRHRRARRRRGAHAAGPTESVTLLPAAIGRGQRTSAHKKTVCTVLDFVGRYRSRVQIDLRHATARRHPQGSRASSRDRVSVPSRRPPHGVGPGRRSTLCRAASEKRLDPIPPRSPKLRALSATRGTSPLPSIWPRRDLELMEHLHRATVDGPTFNRPPESSRLHPDSTRSRFGAGSDGCSTLTTNSGSTVTRTSSRRARRLALIP